MNIGRMKKYLTIPLAVFTIAAAGTLMNSTRGVVHAQSATVAATESGPWNVGIVGTPTVGLAPYTVVGINGIPTVNIAPGQSVGIAGNSETTPLWVTSADNPAKSAFSLSTATPFSGGPDVYTEMQVGTVPAGKRYVIEHYNVTCGVINGGSLADVSVVVGSTGYVRDDAEPHRTGIGPIETGWTGNATTRLYADAGQTISLGAVSHTTNMGFCNGEVSGYAVAVP